MLNLLSVATGKNKTGQSTATDLLLPTCFFTAGCTSGFQLLSCLHQERKTMLIVPTGGQPLGNQRKAINSFHAQQCTSS